MQTSSQLRFIYKTTIQGCKSLEVLDSTTLSPDSKNEPTESNPLTADSRNNSNSETVTDTSETYHTTSSEDSSSSSSGSSIEDDDDDEIIIRSKSTDSHSTDESQDFMETSMNSGGSRKRLSPYVADVDAEKRFKSDDCSSTE